MNTVDLQHKTFLLLLVIASLAFGWILLPFYGAVFWGVVLAVVFTPFYRRLLVGLRQRRNLAAVIMVLLCLILVIFPLSLISAALIQEASTLVHKVSTQEIDLRLHFQKIINVLPQWVLDLFDRFGLTSLANVQEKLSNAAMQGSQALAKQAFSIGQNTAEFFISFAIMVYLLFFLLRDGAALGARIRQAIPLSPEHKRHLLRKLTSVIRATVKGNIVVAMVQGMLGGLIFWILGIPGVLLWSVVMAFLSLLPAVGAGLIWGPVALYFLATGAVWEGVALIVYGVLVIGLVDNILRPVLVGKDTQMPDYLVLISTLGGISLFGLNGFVIGPTIAALFIAVWDLFSESDTPEKNN